MARKRYRGVERHEEFSPTRFRDDVRTPFQRLSDAFDTRHGVVTVYGALALTVLLLGVVPGIGEIGVLASIILYLIYFTYTGRLWRAPYRVPGYVNSKAEKFRDDSTGKPGDGDIYLGWEPSSTLEVWAHCDDYRTHRCVLGTTGSGKTEELLGALFNALILNSGGILVDGKASPNTYESMFRIARYFAREEDFLVLNYIMGGKDIGSGLEQKISHTYNPLSMGSSAMKSELMVSLLDSGTGGNSDMWQGRAISFLEAIIPPLSFLADKGYVLFNPQLLINYFQLPNIENLLWFGIFTDLNGNIVSLKNGSEAEQSIYQELYNRYCGNIRLYVMELPSYGMCKPTKPLHVESMSRETYEMLSRVAEQQAVESGPPAGQKQQPQNGDQARQEVLKQHGFITMQLVRATGNLTFNYGHIYNDEIGEISFRDALLNRRILLALIPGLERSDATMAQLGKMAVASIKSVMGTLLDTPFEGTRRKVIEGLASNAPTPYIIMLDEYGYYVVKGFAVVPAQARSFGVSITFGSQAFTDLLKGSKEEGEATWANTNLKHAGRLRVGADTEDWKRIEGLGGHTYIATSKQLSFNKSDIERFKVGGETSLEQVARVEFNDVTQQQNGEFHLVISKKTDTGRNYSLGGGSVVVRYQAFYTGSLPATLAKDMRFVHYVQVKQFSDTDLPSIERTAKTIQRLADLDQAAIDNANARARPDIIDDFLSYLRAEWSREGARFVPSKAQILAFLAEHGAALASMRKEAASGDAQKTREHQANENRKFLIARLKDASPKDPSLQNAHIDLGTKVIDAWVRRRIEAAAPEESEDAFVAAARRKGGDFFRAAAGRM